MKTTQIIEALLFASDAPLSAEDLIRGEEDLVPEDVVAAVDALRVEYEERGRAFQIYEIAGGYQLLTRPEYSPHLERFETVPQSTRVSSAALEVLAIIAYRQPLGRMEVEDIRGVGSSHVLRTLQELGLIDVVGRGEGLGRPLLYGTTDRFLDHFGFTSLDDLPKPEDLPVILAEATASAEDGEWEAVDSEAVHSEEVDSERPDDEAGRDEAPEPEVGAPAAQESQGPDGPDDPDQAGGTSPDPTGAGTRKEP